MAGRLLRGVGRGEGIVLADPGVDERQQRRRREEHAETRRGAEPADQLAGFDVEARLCQGTPDVDRRAQRDEREVLILRLEREGETFGGEVDVPLTGNLSVVGINQQSSYAVRSVSHGEAPDSAIN